VERTQFEHELPAVIPKLTRLAGRLLGNPEDARDAVQDALLNATAALSGFRGDAKLESWLFGITVRVAIDRLRATQRWKSSRMVDACNERGAARVSALLGNPGVAFDVNEHIGLCFTCVGRSLPAEQQAALVLREVYAFSNAESASMTGDSEPVFRHHLSDARQAMEKEFEGLCSLVNKNGACHQCATLRGIAPQGQEGRPLPAFPLSFEERLRVAHSARDGSESYRPLEDYFLRDMSARNSG
jgi:RNA polymerase sigma-70 factor (ECF subfamily)